MREIKFRAWEKDAGFEDGIDMRLWTWKEMQEIDLAGMFNNPKYEIMQFTGLKDKYGVEIYEGDVVVDRWANEYTPVFQNGIYMAYNPKHLMQSDPSTQFNIIWKDGCEIIGNIYENPELLGAQQ